jgi:hypothetical protein
VTFRVGDWPATEDNYLVLYRQAAGLWKVPPAFHMWTAISVLAAAVADRVAIEILPDEPLPLNLYVLLVGPPGCGKDVAIKRGLRYLASVPTVNIFPGAVTRAGLEDEMSAKQRDTQPTPPSKLFLVTPELGFSVGGPALAEDLVKFLAAVYGGSELPLHTVTRTHGRRVIRAPCLSWLGATQKSWLRRSLPPHVVEAGFIARILPIISEAVETRYAKPIMAQNREELDERIRQKLLRVSLVEGRFRWTEGAWKLYERWTLTRPKPTDARLREWWEREPAHVAKLTGVMSLADDEDLEIRTHHVVAAQKLASTIQGHVTELTTEIAATPEWLDVQLVREQVREAARIPMTQLQRLMARRGVLAVRLAEALHTLNVAGETRVVTESGRGRRVVEWLVRPTPAAADTPDGDGDDVEDAEEA